MLFTTVSNPKLESTTEIIGQIAILRLVGDLCHNTTEAFTNSCRRLMGIADVRHLIIEMSDIGMLDCGALGALVVLHGEAGQQGVTISLCNPSANVYGMLYKAHFHKKFGISPSSFEVVARC